MEIDVHNRKLVFRGEIEDLLDDMQASFDQGRIQQKVGEYQAKLDKLAAKYQNDETLGKIRYKLYEAQAYLHFFNGDYQKAITFIDEAENMRGSTFEGANSLRKAINDKMSLSSEAEEGAPARISGWLSLFVFGLVVGVLYNLYQFATGWSSLNQITPDVSSAYPNLRTLIIVEQIVPLICAIIGCVILYLVFKRSHLVKPIGIIFLAGSLLWFVVDLTLAQQMFANNTAALNQINNISPTQDRNIVFSLAWLAYLIFSKDVKRVFKQ